MEVAAVVWTNVGAPLLFGEIIVKLQGEFHNVAHVIGLVAMVFVVK